MTKVRLDVTTDDVLVFVVVVNDDSDSHCHGVAINPKKVRA
jgi:hypothetical protein